MVGIYKIQSPSNDVYIGQSRNISQRWKNANPTEKGQSKLFNSFKTHSKKNHILSVQHELPIDVSQQVLDSYEVLYIELYSSCGINMLNIRGGGKNGKLSQETKDKIGASNSISLLGNTPSITGKTWEELIGLERASILKKRISDKLSGRKLSKNSIEKRKETYREKGHHSKGKKASTELRKKLSQAHIGVQAGEKSSMSKLTNNQVADIFLSTESVLNLSKIYNMTIQSIYYIKNGKTWGSVTKYLNK